jgi:isopenicillin-N N-acyltransferase like protein
LAVATWDEEVKPMSKRFLPWILAYVLVSGVFGCGQEAPIELEPQAQTPSESAAAEPESMPLSETAAKTEAALEAKDEKAEVRERELPPDHWLVGTSDLKDMFPAVIAPEAPRKLLREHGPAYLEQIGSTRVLHLKGSYYEMGVQHGTLMKEEITKAAGLVHTVGMLSDEKFGDGIKEAWDRTSPHIPAKFKEEIKGMADATGLTAEQVQELTIFPELFHCSGFAFWGKATADGALLHGRVLDYMRDVGLDKWALIIIQEPAGANAFVNVGYSGMVGSVTGMNAKKVAIGEMGGKGDGKWDGMPMTLLIRECLEAGNTIGDVKRIMKETPRTCQYYYVISDAKEMSGNTMACGVAAETDSITFIGPNESHPILDRPVEDAVLISGGGRYGVLVDRVEKMYGRITPEIALDIMARGVSMNSNMHNALFKPATLEMWVANSTVDDPACNLPYTYYDIVKLMTEKPGS